MTVKLKQRRGDMAQMTTVHEVVIDANVLLNFALKKHPYHLQAQQFITDALRDGVHLMSPALWESEADSGIRRMASIGVLTSDAAATAQTLLDAMPVNVVYEPAARVAARQLVDHIKQTKVYDAVYLALAQVRGCDLWTADQRLFNAASTAGLSFVKFIGTYPVPTV